MENLVKNLGIKTQIVAMNYQSKETRKKERSCLKNARQLSGYHSAKHGPDQPRPEIPKKTLIAMELPDAKTEAEKKYEEFWGLSRFRKNILRKELRNTYLAYAFLKGRLYSEVELERYTDPNWDYIEQIVFSYTEDDPRDVKQRFEEWVQTAKKTPRIGQEPEEEKLPMSMRVR